MICLCASLHTRDWFKLVKKRKVEKTSPAVHKRKNDKHSLKK